MAEPNDTGQEPKPEDKGQETQTPTPSSPPSGTDWEAQAKHFQGLFNKAEDAAKKAQAERDALKASQDEATRKELEQKEEFQKLYEQEKTSKAEIEAAMAKLDLQVKLQAHLAEKAPDYVTDYKWIAPHVDSAENLASVVEDYTKAHPKAAGAPGTASTGNRSKDGKTVEEISRADLNDPVRLAELVRKDPSLEIKLLSGEIEVTG